MKKNKLALITIHNVNNYGAILQTVASYIVLSKFCDVTIIDYENKQFRHSLSVIRFSWTLKGILTAAHDLVRLQWRLKAISRAKKYIKNHTTMSRQLDKAEAKSIFNKSHYDILAAGSDQTWNPKITNLEGKIDSIYFLESDDKSVKRISFSSSAGAHTYSLEESKRLSKLLEVFNAISVRENLFSKYLTALLNRKVAHTLDPTLLLSKNEWAATTGVPSPTTQQDYILVYSVPRSPLLEPAIKFYKKKLGLKVISIEQRLLPIKYVDRQIRNAGPEEFIQLFQNARFIVTDSFHGTCFSLIFEKPFVVASPGPAVNRIESLLEEIGLKERIVSTYDQLGSLDCEICFEQPIAKLQLKKEATMTFIKESLKD